MKQFWMNPICIPIVKEFHYKPCFMIFIIIILVQFEWHGLALLLVTFWVKCDIHCTTKLNRRWKTNFWQPFTVDHYYDENIRRMFRINVKFLGFYVLGRSLILFSWHGARFKLALIQFGSFQFSSDETKQFMRLIQGQKWVKEEKASEREKSKGEKK